MTEQELKDKQELFSFGFFILALLIVIPMLVKGGKGGWWYVLLFLVIAPSAAMLGSQLVYITKSKSVTDSTPVAN